MINLLPPKEKEQLIFESNKKLTIVLGNMVLISLVSLVLVLFSLKFYILEELVYQKGILSSIEKEYQDPDLVLAKEVMQKYNGVIIKMDNFYKNQVYLSDNTRLISSIERPKGLYFKSISLESGEKKNINVRITGFSNNRENLQVFNNNLQNIQSDQGSGRIENIYFPPYVWLTSKNIDFSVTFTIVQHEN